MEFSPEILEELNSISPLLAKIEKENVFSVPEGYFDTLAIDLYKKLNIDLIGVNNLSVPENYFENLSREILNKIKDSEIDAAQELRKLSPMLYSIQNEKVFNVPTGYFQNLPDNILNKISDRQQAKIIPFKRKDSVWRMAAAAVVTGIIAVSSLMVFNKPKTNIDESVSAFVQEAAQYKNNQQVNAGIASLSDDEIIKYLEKTGNDIDSEILTANIDESTLPEQKDYLLNEHTLDTYLNDINKKDSKN